MRVAVIAPPWAPVPPELYGGIEQVVDRQARGFQDAGHEVLLFATGDSTCPVPRKWVLEEAEGQRIGAAVPELRHVVAAYEAVRDFDVVYDHTMAGPVLAGQYTSAPVVTMIHGPFNDELTDIYARVASRVPIVAVSHSQRAGAPQVPVARVVHHGIDASEFPFGAGDGGYALFLGRMHPDKGPQRAVAAARKAGMPLKLAGKMREAKELEFFDAEVRPHLGPDVEYVGEVPHEEKSRLLADAAALLFPIRWAEPFGLVMIEAMACGTPVLAFPEGSVPEVVDHGRTGFVCDDEADMADALGRVGALDRRTCRAAVEGYFSTERMVAEHLELFEALVAQR